MTSAYSINLNFNNTIPVKTDFTFKQGDKGITLNLATTGLDTTGTTAHIVFKRSNGTSVEAELTGQTGPSYSYTILGNEFEIPGVVVADLKLYNGDTQRVSTASFIFLVTGDTMDGVGGGTGGYSDQLEQLSAEFQDTLDDYIDAFGNTAPINPRGDYDNTETYEPRDMVYDPNTGTSWVAKVETTGHAPASPSAYWQKLVNSSGSANLGDLADVDTTGAASGDLLGFNGADWESVDFPDADDIDYDNSSSGLTATKVRAAIDEVKGLIPTIPTIPEKTSDLSDVASTTPTNGQILKYNGTSQKYEPANESGSATAAEKTDLTSIIATGSTNTTGAQIPARTYFYLNGVLCISIADIAANATFTLNTNYIETTIADALNRDYEEESATGHSTFGSLFTALAQKIDYNRITSSSYVIVYGGGAGNLFKVVQYSKNSSNVVQIKCAGSWLDYDGSNWFMVFEQLTLRTNGGSTYISKNQNLTITNDYTNSTPNLPYRFYY